MPFVADLKSLRLWKFPALGAGSGPLLGLLLLSLWIKSALVWKLGGYSPDSALYIAAASHFEAGSWAAGFAVYPLPVLSLLLALLHRYLGSWEAAAYLCSVVPAVLTLVPIYRLTTDLFDRRAAFWAAAAFALSPYLNKFGAELIRDPLFLFCFAWAVAQAARFLITESKLSLLGCMIMFWASLLFRIDGVYLFPVLPALLLGLAWAQPRRRAVLAKAALLWVGLPMIVLAAVAWLFPDQWLAVTQGDFISMRLRDLLSLRFLDHYRAISLGLADLEAADQGWAGGLFPEMARHYLLVLYGLLLIEYFLRLLFVPYALPLAVGLWMPGHERARWLPPAAAFGFGLVSYLYLLQEGWIAKRYLSLLVVLATPYVGRGMVGLLEAAARSRWMRAVAVAAVAGFFLLPLWASAGLALENADSALRPAGQWIAAQKSWRSAKIYSTDNRVLLYAGRIADIPTWERHGDLKAPLRSIHDSKKLVLVVVETENRSFQDTLSDLKNFSEARYFKGRHRRVMVLCRPGTGGAPE